MSKYLLISLLIYLNCQSIYGQKFSEIEKEVIRNNKSGKFEKSIEIVTGFLNSNKATPYEKYQAYILKADTHKTLFDYDNTFKSLELALKEGVNSEQKDEVVANVKAEKAFAFFDIQKYKESALLMKEIKESNYKNLDLVTTSYIVMQDGYLDFLNGNFDAAEKKYDESISFMKKAELENLPVIYGKKILLYSKMQDGEKALNAFNEGKKIASSPKNLKYLLYLNESLRTFYEENNEWELADKTFHRVDSLRTMYNSEESTNKINLLEKDLEIQKKDNEIKQTKLFRNSLLVICLFLILGIYLSIRLYKSNKEKSLLFEKENIRIHDELQLLTNSLNSQGFTKIDLSKFNLSERQLEIIELVRLGKSNKEIANQIFISENTVKYHLKAIYDILNIENRSEFFKLINK
jgi:DNA-binding CsgD family transcriptional regulator